MSQKADLPAYVPHGCRAPVHEQDRRRVETHRAHPGRELRDLLRVDALVGEDLPLLGRRGTCERSRQPTRPRTVSPESEYSWR